MNGSGFRITLTSGFTVNENVTVVGIIFRSFSAGVFCRKGSIDGLCVDVTKLDGCQHLVSFGGAYCDLI